MIQSSVWEAHTLLPGAFIYIDCILQKQSSYVYDCTSAETNTRDSYV